MVTTEIINALEPYGLKKEGHNKYRCKSNPFRPDSNSNSFTVITYPDDNVGWKDHKEDTSGGTKELCEVLNIPYHTRKEATDTKTFYSNIDEYAKAHGVDKAVLEQAGWQQKVIWDGYGDDRKERMVLQFPTATGTRYRFIDGNTPYYKSVRGYTNCWYGLEDVIKDNDTLILCNGEISTIVAQHYGLPAFAMTGGEKTAIPDSLMPELRVQAKDKHIIIALDCDDKGRKSAHGIRKQLMAEGFEVTAKDMMLSKGGDLADFCKLHGVDSLTALLDTPDVVIVDNDDDENISSSRPSKPTDDELGDRVIAKWDGKFAYFYGQWYQYDNGVWTVAQSMLLDIWNELKIAKAEGIRPSDSKAKSIEKYIQLMLMVDDDKIDKHLDLINLQNGVYNLDTETLEPHQQSHYMTSQLPFEFDAQAQPRVLYQFLESAFKLRDGITDYDLILLAQEAVGYSLTSNTDHRVSFWLVGESGTGKSVFINLLATLAGSSYVTIDLDQLSQSPYQLADIAGKRVVTFTEPSARSVLADNHYKRLVSQDEILARQIFGKPFRFTPICKVWGAMNDTPRVLDRSDAVFNRVIIINMNYIVPQHERDPRLLDKLKSELPGIFNWALEGLIRLRNKGKFTQAKQAEQAREDYKAENDTEGAFAEECLEFSLDHKIGGQHLYDAYNSWCKRNGTFPKSSTKVSKDWIRLGLKKVRSNGTWYHGAKLIPVEF